jgi:hypothetical protein
MPDFKLPEKGLPKKQKIEAKLQNGLAVMLINKIDRTRIAANIFE